MKHLLKGVCVAVLAVCATTVFAGTKIGIVNMEQIFKNSAQVKKINTDLRTKFSSQRTEIVNLSKKLQGEMQVYSKNKSVMSKKDAADQAKAIAAQETALRTKQAGFQKQLFQSQNEAMGAFMKKVEAAVAKVAKKEGMDLVMPNNAAVYSKDGMDVTKEVMKNVG